MASHTRGIHLPIVGSDARRPGTEVSLRDPIRYLANGKWT